MVSLIFHLFVSDVDPGNEDFMCKRVGAKIFLHGPRDGKVFLRLQCICDSIFLVVNLILLNVI